MSSVLFIYPPISFEERGAVSAYSPPLGALYLATMLKKEGHEVHVVDADAERLSLAQVRSRIESIDPDVIGLTCLTLTLDSCKAIVREARNVSDAYIVIGGPHIGVAPQKSLNGIGADAYVVGEAETDVGRIVTEKPRGIIYAREIQNLDTIPFPDRSLVEHIEYGRYYGVTMVENVTGILTSRGCKYGCTYCNRPKKLSYRIRSPRNILQELKELDRAGFDSVWIADDNFTNYPQNVIKLARLIKRNKLKFHFFGQARVDVPSKTLYESMRDMGVVALSYGVESIEPEIVRWYNKTRYPERWPGYVEKTMKLCDEYGIIFLGSLIFGAPMETREQMERSIDFMEKGGVEMLNGNILMYMVGSALWQWARDMGKIRLDQFVATAPELGLTPYSEAELRELCVRCTDYWKSEGWKKAVRKELKSRRFGLVFYGLRKYVKHYWSIRRIRKEVYGYGYGKEYTTKI